MTDTQQQTLTDRIDAALKATEGHTAGPWDEGREGNGAVGRVYCDNDLGSAVAIVYGKELPYQALSSTELTANAALIAAAPTLRALHTEAQAELRAQAEALARAGQADKLIREWFAEMVGVEKAEGEYRQDQTLGDALTQAHTRKLRAEIKLATYAAPSAAATFGLTESNMDAALGG